MAEQVFAKCAWRLIPFMLLLYVVSFVDRSNVGFAALTMNKDLGFSPAIFGFGAGVFFIGYVLFQVPVAILLERVGARRLIFSIMAVWGLVSAANAFVLGPPPGLEKIHAALLAVNSADDERNPAELGLMEPAIKRIKNARYYLIPASPETRGHGTVGLAKLWKQQLADFLLAAPHLAGGH